MHPIEAFIKSPVKVTVGVLLVVLFGFIALFRMPVQLTPEVQTPTLTIETRWRGASPQEVEREIIQEQEAQLKGVEGVTKLSSEAMDSNARITLEFPVGTDMAEALLKVNTRLQQVREYPEDADEPVISTSNASDSPIAWFMLTARVPEKEELHEYAEKHPEYAEALQPAIRAPNSAIRNDRLRRAAAQHPALRELLPPDIDVVKLRKFAEDVIESRFERVPGVAQSNVLGGQIEEMQVIIDPERLAARSLTIADVRTALRGQNKDTSGGDFWEGKRRYVVRSLGQYRSAEQVANTIIARREGVPVYIRDVGTVQLGYKKPDGLVRHLGMPCISVNCLRETGANVLEVMEGLRIANAELNRGVLRQRGLMLEQVYDETEYIYSAIGLVNSNIVVGGALTFATLLIFLRRIAPTIVISLAIPTSIIGTFLVMQLMGRSLNVISLAGIAFAVGMLVDNAVVVLENIFRHRYQLGEPPFVAAFRGAKEVWGAVVASTLTTLAVFIPVLFVQEEAGQLFRDIALAISAAVGLSLIVSITVIPPAAARLFGGKTDAECEGGDTSSTGAGSAAGREENLAGPTSRWGRIVHRVLAPVRLALSPLDRLANAFLSSIVAINAFLQRRRAAGLAAVLGFTLAAVYLSYLMLPSVEYLPSGNRNLVFGILLPPPGYNLDHLMDLAKQLEQELLPYCDVDLDDPKAAELEYPVIGDLFFVVRGRQVFMGLRAADPVRAGELIPLVRKVATNLPGTFAVAKQSSLFERGLSAGRTVDIEIRGPELTKLIALGAQVFAKVREVVPGSQAIPQPSLDLSSPEVHVIPKWEYTADMGIDATSLGYWVDVLVDGGYAADYFKGGDKIDLSIVGQQRFVNRTQDVEALSIATPTGELVPIKAVANVELRSGPEQINHRERLRAITVQVTPPPQMAVEAAMSAIREQIVEPLEQSGQLEAGVYQITLAGTADKLRQAWQALRFNVFLALLITYLLMAALFESWLYPFVVILSVPLGAVGGFAGLWLLNFFMLQPLDVLTMLGFVILVGTVVNNPILIVEQALIHMREDHMKPGAAVVESVRNRIRPIFMTTMTTVLGLLPLVLFPGAGSELYRGLGSVVLGGLLVSTIVSLIVVPTIFNLLMTSKEAILNLVGRHSKEVAATLEPAPGASTAS